MENATGDLNMNFKVIFCLAAVNRYFSSDCSYSKFWRLKYPHRLEYICVCANLFSSSKSKSHSCLYCAKQKEAGVQDSPCFLCCSL